MDGGDIPVPVISGVPVGGQAKNLREVVSVSQALCGRVSEVMSHATIPITIGGDHSLAIGSIAGAANFLRGQGAENLGVLWVDAHADSNTPETSSTGNIHGMPLAAVLGFGARKLTEVGGTSPKVRPENVVIFALRILDPGERDLLRRLAVRCMTMNEVEERGIATATTEVLERLRQRVKHLHVSFDLDAIDPAEAPGVSTPETGGLSTREAHFLLDQVARSGLLCSADFAELNPLKDQGQRTACLTVDLVSSLLGKARL